MKFTNSNFKKLEEGKEIWDGAVRGLHVRKRKTSTNFYLFYRTKEGTVRKPLIGSASEISITDARKIAKDIKLQVAQGKDPQAERKERREALTVASAFEEVLKVEWSKKRFQDSGYAREVVSYFNNHLKPLHNKKLCDLGYSEVNNWFQNIEKSTTANRALSVLSKLCIHAIQQGFIQNNPCAYIKRRTEKKRARVASDEELKLIWREVEELATAEAMAIKFVMLTGCRPKDINKIVNINRLQDSLEVSIKGKTFEETGTFDTYILHGLQASVFHWYLKDNKLKYPRTLWSNICSKYAIEGLWFRDLRRTYASKALEASVELGSIGELLNHSSVETTKRYAKLTNVKKRQDSKAVQASMLAAACDSQNESDCENQLELELEF